MGPSPHLSFCACKTTTIRARITSLYGSQTSPMVFCIQNKATLAPEFLVSIFPSPHLWLFICKTATFGSELQVSMGPCPHLWFVACKTATLGPELSSLYGSQTSPMVFCIQNSNFSTRITSLYRIPALFCCFGACKTATFWIRIT